MSDFDQELKQLLGAHEHTHISDAIDENGYYKTAFDSFKGPGSGLRILSAIGTIVVVFVMLFCIWKFFQADTIKDQIFYATATIMLNATQITLKLWFNMQLNRRLVIYEIRRLGLILGAGKST